MKTGKYVSKVLMSVSLVLTLATPTMQNVFAENYQEGATVVKDESSPSGYSVHFVYDAPSNVDSVSVQGSFGYINPDKNVLDESNVYSPEEYVNGYYPTNYIPSIGTNYIEEMNFNSELERYELSFPITSGIFTYSYVLKYDDDSTKTIADPANQAVFNSNSDSQTSNENASVILGKYDSKKQSKSPDYSFVEPTSKQGTMTYVEYTGSVSQHQDLGVYLPPDYDASRPEKYKVIYASHGMGGNETDWFNFGQAQNIMDHINAKRNNDIIFVTMDNTLYSWSYSDIENNIINYVIPFMEKNYNVSTKVEDRAMCGLSAGAMTTNVMFFDYPNTFKYYGMFSGCFTSLSKLTDGQDQTQLMIVAGTCDVGSTTINPDPGPGLKYEFIKNWLVENNFNNYKDYGLIPGGHDWFTWSKSLYLFGTEVAFKDEEKVPTPVEKNPDEISSSNDTTVEDSVSAVKTGDNTNSIGFVMLLGVSAAYIFMIERKKLQ